MTTVKDITDQIEKYAPKYLAEGWDPIGLAFGSSQKEVKKMMVALDLDRNTLDEAKEKGVDFIFTHHPPIFSSLNTLNEDHSRRKEYMELIRSDISLYAAHTNIDATEDGMNDWLAEALELEKPYEVIEKGYEEPLKLLVLYTPYENAVEVRQALHEAGAGRVGDYKDVSYTADGKGHFTPQSDANPAIGEKNKSEDVAEERGEMLVPQRLIGEVIQTIYDVHPYEEPVYHLLDIGENEKTYGMGRIGVLKEPMVLSAFIEKVKEVFHLSFVRYANMNIKQKVKRIGILGGSGEKYYKEALRKDVDVFITGDISYHGAQDMIRDGLPFIDAGHFIENIFVEEMTERLNKWNNEFKWGIDVIPADSQTDVFLHQ